MLALKGRRRWRDWGWARVTPGPVFLRMDQREAKLRTIPFASFSPPKSSTSGVQCVMEREAGQPHLPSKNQCCPGAQGLQGPSPVSALCLLQASPRDGKKRPERVWPQPRWVGRGMLGEEQRGVSSQQARPVVTLPLSSQGWGRGHWLLWLLWLAPGSPDGGLGGRVHAVLSASSARNRCSWEKGGRCSGSRLQH